MNDATTSMSVLLFRPSWSRRIREPVLLLVNDPVKLLASTARTWQVYTEGSVIGGRTGNGVIVYDNEKVLATCQGRLPNGCSIFQAEGAGLGAALQYLTTNNDKFNAADILVDSHLV